MPDLPITKRWIDSLYNKPAPIKEEYELALDVLLQEPSFQEKLMQMVSGNSHQERVVLKMKDLLPQHFSALSLKHPDFCYSLRNSIIYRQPKTQVLFEKFITAYELLK